MPACVLVGPHFFPFLTFRMYLIHVDTPNSYILQISQFSLSKIGLRLKGIFDKASTEKILKSGI